MRMLSHSEGIGILILTKGAFWPRVDVCEGSRSFRTQVIKYLFGLFVPTNQPFRTHVISLPLWSVSSNLVTKCRKWLRNDDCHTILVISYLYFVYFVPIYI